VPTTYDFGLSAPAIAVAKPLPGTLAIAAVSAPAWLASDGIIYRLAYDNAARPEIYSQSRWVAPPTELFGQRLHQRLADVAAGGLTDGASRVDADYLLRVELEEFSQVFDARDRSRALVRARASLIDQQQDALVAQNQFSAERPAAPDAAGAAQGLREASDVMLNQLTTWLLVQVEVAAQQAR
jgi:cholesterol transport system auxiliary component